MLTEAGGQEKPVCLLIDGLSVLLDVGVALCDVIRLVQLCLHLLTAPHSACQVSDLPHTLTGDYWSTQGQGYMVVMVQGGEGGGGGGEGGREPEHLLCNYLLHLSQLHLHAQGLHTGHSKEIHGQVYKQCETVSKLVVTQYDGDTMLVCPLQVSVCWRDPHCSSSGQKLPAPQNAHYKLTDKAVQIFAKGTAPTII